MCWLTGRTSKPDHRNEGNEHGQRYAPHQHHPHRPAKLAPHRTTPRWRVSCSRSSSSLLISVLVSIEPSDRLQTSKATSWASTALGHLQNSVVRGARSTVMNTAIRLVACPPTLAAVFAAVHSRCGSLEHARVDHLRVARSGRHRRDGAGKIVADWCQLRSPSVLLNTPPPAA